MSEEMSELHQLDEKYILKLEATIAELEEQITEIPTLCRKYEAKITELKNLIADLRRPEYPNSFQIWSRTSLSIEIAPSHVG